MKITIEATPEEIAKMLQAIGSSKEQEEPYIAIDEKRLEKLIHDPKSIIDS